MAGWTQRWPASAALAFRSVVRFAFMRGIRLCRLGYICALWKKTCAVAKLIATNRIQPPMSPTTTSGRCSGHAWADVALNAWPVTVPPAGGTKLSASPVLNPGLLKHVLDCLKEYIHKAVGLVGVSAGPFGGTRVIQNLLPVMRELGLVTIFWDMNFSSVQNVFDPEGRLRDEAFLKRINKFLKELI